MVNDGESNIVWIGGFCLGRNLSCLVACHICALVNLQSKESIINLIFVCLNKFYLGLGFVSAFVLVGIFAIRGEVLKFFHGTEADRLHVRGVEFLWKLS